jgi:hypothetical protein
MSIPQMPTEQMHTAVAAIMESEGFRPAVDFVVHGSALHISRRAADHFKSLGIPGSEQVCGADSLADIALERPFLHPLSESMECNGEPGLNSWGCVSMIINAAMLWGDQPNDDGLSARTMLQKWVFLEKPDLNFLDMLQQIRWNDDALMQLAAIAESGFNKMAQSFSQK